MLFLLFFFPLKISTIIKDLRKQILPVSKLEDKVILFSYNHFLTTASNCLAGGGVSHLIDEETGSEGAQPQA